MFHVPEKQRIVRGSHATTKNDGNNGSFWIRLEPLKPPYLAVASDGEGWEHVSVSQPGRAKTPPWSVMCAIKDLFWDEEDVAIQIHPPKSEHVNFHPYCLHLWRKAGTNDFCERPTALMVGPKGITFDPAKSVTENLAKNNLL